MKGNTNRIFALLLLIVCVLLMGSVAYGHDVLDMDRPCSVSFTLQRGEKPVGGGTLTLHRVAKAVADDGDFVFAITEDFAASGESLANLQDAELAKRLATFADRNEFVGITQDIAKDGTVKFEGLEAGLYLVIQQRAASGYKKLTPFLISLPYVQDGQYVYDLESLPKTELEPEKKPTTTPEPDPEPLPQTGQLWWPVPILLCGGLGCIVIGAVLNRRKYSDEN